MRARLGRILRIVSWANQLQIPFFAANAAFFLLLSLFPAMLLLLQMLQRTGLSQQDFGMFLAPLMPDALLPVFDALMQELQVPQGAMFFSLSAVLTLWSASRGVLGLLTGIAGVEDITPHPIYTRMIALLFTALFPAALTVTFGLYTVGQTLMPMILPIRAPAYRLIIILLRGKGCIAAVLLTLSFSLVFSCYPRRHAWSSVLPGSLLAAAGWVIVSWLFSVYAGAVLRASRLYGSVAWFALALLWLFVCLKIVLYGSAINTLLQRRRPREKPGKTAS